MKDELELIKMQNQQVEIKMDNVLLMNTMQGFLQGWKRKPCYPQINIKLQNAFNRPFNIMTPSM